MLCFNIEVMHGFIVYCANKKNRFLTFPVRMHFVKKNIHMDISVTVKHRVVIFSENNRTKNFNVQNV